MVTVHKTEIARQNNTVNIFWDFLRPNICWDPAHQDGHFNVILCVILPLKRNKLHF